MPCDQVGSLPELTLDLGGYNLTVGGWDYTVKIQFTLPFCKVQEHCSLLIQGSEVYLGPKQVIFGSKFLKNFNSVFDMDDELSSLLKKNVHRISARPVWRLMTTFSNSKAKLQLYSPSYILKLQCHTHKMYITVDLGRDCDCIISEGMELTRLSSWH